MSGDRLSLGHGLPCHRHACWPTAPCSCATRWAGCTRQDAIAPQVYTGARARRKATRMHNAREHEAMKRTPRTFAGERCSSGYTHIHHIKLGAARSGQRLLTWAHEAEVDMPQITGHAGDCAGGCALTPGLAPCLGVPGKHGQPRRQGRPWRGAWGRPPDGRRAGGRPAAAAAAATCAGTPAVLHPWHVGWPVALLGCIVKAAGHAQSSHRRVRRSPGRAPSSRCQAGHHLLARVGIQSSRRV